MAQKNSRSTASRAKSQDGNRPAHKMRIGRLRATIWENQHEKGPWYSVTFERSYKDGQGNWQSASSYGRDDLLVLAELQRLAFHWIVSKQAGDAAGLEEPEREPGTSEELTF